MKQHCIITDGTGGMGRAVNSNLQSDAYCGVVDPGKAKDAALQMMPACYSRTDVTKSNDKRDLLLVAIKSFGLRCGCPAERAFGE